MRRLGPALLGMALALSGCGGAGVAADGWSAGASLGGAEPLHPPEVVEPLTKALDGTSRVSITVPRVYRVHLRGQVGRDGLSTDVAVGAWLLVITPYAAAPGPTVNDTNVVDLGLVTDTSPIEGRPGALWFGTHTSVMGDLDLGGVTPNAGPVDLVTQSVDADRLVAEVVPTLAPLNPLNLFDVDEGGVLGAVGEGAVQLWFDEDASAVSGRIDFADPASGATYTAELSGSATS